MAVLIGTFIVLPIINLWISILVSVLSNLSLSFAFTKVLLVAVAISSLVLSIVLVIEVGDWLVEYIIYRKTHAIN
jgi:hypothetical protein